MRDQKMTEVQEKALEDVAKYFARLSLEKRKGEGLKAAVVHLTRTAGYEQMGNVTRPTFKHTAHILKEVESDLVAWEAMALMVKHYAKNGLPLTDDMACFITRMLDGELVKPKLSSSAWEHLDRDLPLAMAVHMLNKQSVDIATAIESVADIAAKQGVHLGGEGIRKIWNRHKEHVRKTADLGPNYYTEKQVFPLKR